VPLPQEYQQAPQTHEARLLGGAQIAGRVIDPSGGVISGAQVRVLDNNGAEISEQQATTAANTVCQAFPTETTGLRLKVKDSIGWW